MKSVVLLTADPVQMKEFREALRDLPGLKVEQEAQSTKAALDSLRREPADILIADLFLGESASGLDFLKTIKKSNDRITFILVTRIKDRGLVDRAFRFGAADVLPYPMAKDTLRETLKHRLHWLAGTAAHLAKAEAEEET
ncbi:MAG: response regulator [Proteobacteria bacterium]|nr:MAG: response regulator [Pseudomonadota bacterium]